MYLQDVFPNDEDAGGLGRFAFWPEARLTEQDYNEEKGTRIWASWSKYWYPSQNYLIEKSPGNLIRPRFLQALSPKSLFVFILRHPIAVTLVTKKWSNTTMFSLMTHWIRAHEIMVSDLPDLRHAIVLSYEEFVADPKNVIQQIFDFLSLDTPPADNSSFVQNRNDAYFDKWTNFLATQSERRHRQRSQLREHLSRAGREPRHLRSEVWRTATDLSEEVFGNSIELAMYPREAEDLCLYYGQIVEKYGYSLSDLHRYPSIADLRRLGD
ncbi:sulfotransferase [Gammaproteobacteria bacterium]|nr:sulfotransferase [Gammaproteobacteria bacterium]